MLPVIDWGESFTVDDRIICCPSLPALQPRSRSCPPFVRGGLLPSSGKGLPQRHSCGALEIAAVAPGSVSKLSMICASTEGSWADEQGCCSTSDAPGKLQGIFTSCILAQWLSGLLVAIHRWLVWDQPKRLLPQQAS